MSTQFDKLEKCYEYCKTVTDFIPRVGLILGSGLGGYAKNMKVVKEISYDQIPGSRFQQCRDMMEISPWLYRESSCNGNERTRSFL